MPTDPRPTQLDLFAADAAGPADPEPAAARPLPDAAARAFAVDPGNHVVLEASAGTGKTTVLVRRYLALLTAGVDPRNILAITFTRKAAAEMRERIVRELRAAAGTSADGRQRWLRLRDRLGDVAISTIDAFCLALLREFPLEADLDPSFAVADETEVARIIEDALDEALRLTRAQAGTDEDVALVFSQLSTPRARQGLRHLLDRRHVAPAALHRYLAGQPETTAAEATRQATRAALDALQALPGGLEAFLQHGPVERARFRLLAADLRALQAAPWPSPGSLRAVLDELRELSLTKTGRPRRRPGSARTDFVTKDAWAHHSRAIETAGPQMEQVLAAFDRDLNGALARGVWRVFGIALDRYRRSLAAHDVVDFADALERAVRLLEQMDEFAQSRYRLESRYHHVLVDELQDTSRLQWQLVSLLVESWGEGFGLVNEAPLPPSIFVVGDRKQSIYRFRDAEVAVLDEAATFIAALRPGSTPRRSITHSFRAVPGLLRFVNDVFASVEQIEGRSDAFHYGPDDRFPVEGASGSGLQAPGSEGQTPGPAVGLIAADDGRRVTAALGDEIARLLREGQVRDVQTGVTREARPGDIAVLFRTRESHHEIEEALEARRIPSYVYKGLGFFEADEIQDLSALLRYLAAPHSPARAAAFLRSRFVRLSDHALRALGRQASQALLVGPAGEGRWSELEPDDRRVLAALVSALPRWRSLVDRVPPAEVLDTVIAESAYAWELRGVRRQQAEENVKKLRALVRRIQNRGYATLDRLASHLDRLSAGDESNAAIDAVNAVNLMTVHAAKGLEFPVVFIVNLARGAGTTPPPVRVVVDAGQGEPDVAIGAFRSDADEEERTRDREETKRLLYVALTRARDRLYLATQTTGGEFKPSRGSLGEVLPAPLGDLFDAVATGQAVASLSWTPPAGAPHRFSVCRPADAAPTGPTLVGAAPVPTRVTETPGSAPRPVGPGGRVAWSQATVSALVRPHSMREAADTRETPGDAETGRLVHRLFQQGLPLDAGRESVASVAARLLGGADLTAVVDAEAIVNGAVGAFCALRSRDDLRRVLASGQALFEVPFSLRDDAAGLVVRGSIDCLAPGDAGGWIVVELKTGRRAWWHQAQLDRYVEAARALFPGSPITGWLVYAQAEDGPDESAGAARQRE